MKWKWRGLYPLRREVWKRLVFIPIPKKSNSKECSNYCTIALISHARKVMLKILQARLQQYLNQELPELRAGFRKGRRTWDQIANICWITKKARESRKTSALLTTPKPLTVWINWKILKEMGILDHLTCLRNLYAGQEATVRTRHGTTDWFQIGKGVCQDCLFNFYAEYIMQKVRLNEVQAGIKIDGKNISNLGYVADTTIMAESEEELCCDSWGCKESDTTERLNWTEAHQASVSITNS